MPCKNINIESGNDTNNVIRKLFQQTLNSFLPLRASDEDIEDLWDSCLLKILSNCHKKRIRATSQKGLLGDIYLFYLEHCLIKNSNDSSLKIVKRKKNKEQKAKIYTPLPVVKVISKKAFHYYLKYKDRLSEREKRGQSLRIADISCGTGRFLHFWEDSIEELLKKQERKYRFHLYGFDSDEKAITLAQQIEGELKRERQFSRNKENLLSHTFIYCDVLRTVLFYEEYFDIIIGNPPYIESRSLSHDLKSFLEKHYKSAIKRFDISIIFLEKILNSLKEGGIGALIISNKWLTSQYGKKIREMLLNEAMILELIDVSQFEVFPNVSTYPLIIFFRKKKKIEKEKMENEVLIKKITLTPEKREMIKRDKMWILHQLILEGEEKCLYAKDIKTIPIPQKIFLKLPEMIIPLQITKQGFLLMKKMVEGLGKRYFRFGEEASPYILRKGIHSGNIKQKLILKESDVKEKQRGSLEKQNLHKMITSKNSLSRYYIKWDHLYINYNENLIDREQGEYASLREEWIFRTRPKLFIKLFGKHLQAALDDEGFFCNNSIVLVLSRKAKPRHSKEEKRREDEIKKDSPTPPFPSIWKEFYYLLGILNSHIVSGYYTLYYWGNHVRGGYMQFYIKNLNKLILPKITEENLESALKIAELARELQDLYSWKHRSNKKNLDTSLHYDKVGKEIEARENEIEEKVAYLYNLTEEEKKYLHSLVTI